MSSQLSPRAQQVDAVYADLFGAHLSPLGFTLIGRRRWARDRLPLTRDVFSLDPTRTALLRPTWGFSFAFVPHIAGGRLRWHRTPRSVVFDVTDYPAMTITGLDADRLDLPTSHDRDHLVCEARKVAPVVVPMAVALWDSVPSLDALPDLFEVLKQRPTRGLGFYNYVQQPLACAFTLARLGRALEARNELHRSPSYEDGHVSVRQALDAALSAALTEGFPE